jgi:hypothetical protein
MRPRIRVDRIGMPAQIYEEEYSVDLQVDAVH